MRPSRLRPSLRARLQDAAAQRAPLIVYFHGPRWTSEDEAAVSAVRELGQRGPLEVETFAAYRSPQAIKDLKLSSLPQVQLWALGSQRETVFGRPSAADLQRLGAVLEDLDAPAGSQSAAAAHARGAAYLLSGDPMGAKQYFGVSHADAAACDVLGNQSFAELLDAWSAADPALAEELSGEEDFRKRVQVALRFRGLQDPKLLAIAALRARAETPGSDEEAAVAAAFLDGRLRDAVDGALGLYSANAEDVARWVAAQKPDVPERELSAKPWRELLVEVLVALGPENEEVRRALYELEKRGGDGRVDFEPAFAPRRFERFVGKKGPGRKFKRKWQFGGPMWCVPMTKTWKSGYAAEAEHDNCFPHPRSPVASHALEDLQVTAAGDMSSHGARGSPVPAEARSVATAAFLEKLAQRQD